MFCKFFLIFKSPVPSLPPAVLLCVQLVGGRGIKAVSKNSNDDVIVPLLLIVTRGPTVQSLRVAFSSSLA